MASQLGLTQQNVTGSVLVSLSSTTQVAPNFWSTGQPGQLPGGRATPDYHFDSVDTLLNTPIINGLTRRLARGRRSTAKPAQRRNC